MATPFTADSQIVSRGQQVTITLRQWIHNAWGYQWLTAEPEPTTIVINLRESMALVPILHLFELFVPQESRVVQMCVSYYRGMTIQRRVRTAPIRIASVVILCITLVGFLLSAVAGSLELVKGVILLIVATASLVGLYDTRSWSELCESETANAIRELFTPPSAKGELNDKET